MDPIIVPIGLDPTSYESGFNKLVNETQQGLSKLTQLATQASTAVGSIGRAYQQQSTAFAQAIHLQDEATRSFNNMASAYNTGSRAFQTGINAFMQAGGVAAAKSKEWATAMQGALGAFFGLGSQLATNVAASLSRFGTMIQSSLPGIDALDHALQHVGISLGGLGKLAIPAALFGGMIEGIKAAADFEQAFTAVRRQVEFVGDESTTTAEKFDQLAEGLRHISSETGVAATSLAGIASEAGHLGLQSVHDIERFTETMGKLQVVTGISGKQLASSFAELSIQMDDTLDNAEKMGSALLYLANHSRASESAILGMATNIAGMGKSIGLTTPEVMGFGSALASFGASPMAVTRLLQTMGRAAREGGGELDLLAKTAGMSSQAFQNLLRSGQGAEALSRFFEGGKKLGTDFSVVLENLNLGSGRIVKSFLLAANASGLFNKEISLVRENFDNARKGWEENTTLADEFNTAMDAVWAQLGKLKNAIDETLVTAFKGALGPIKAVIEGLTEFVQFIDRHPVLAKLAGDAVLVSAAFLGTGLALRGLVGLFSTAFTGLASFLTLLEKIIGTKFGLTLLTWFKDIQTVFMEGGGLLGLFSRFGAAISGVVETLMGSGGLMIAVRAVIAFFSGPAGWIALIATAVTALGILEAKTGMVSDAFEAMLQSLKEFTVGLGVLISRWWAPVAEFIGKILDVADSIWQPIAAALQPVVEYIEKIFTWVWENVLKPFLGYIANEAYKVVKPFVDAYTYITSLGRQSIAEAEEAQAQWVNSTTQGALNAQRAMERQSENTSKIVKKSAEEEEAIRKIQSKQFVERLQAQSALIAADFAGRQAIAQASDQVLVDLGEKTQKALLEDQMEANNAQMAEALRLKQVAIRAAEDEGAGKQKAIDAANLAYKQSMDKLVAERITTSGKIRKIDQDEAEEMAKNNVMRIDASEKAAQAITDNMKKVQHEIDNIGLAPMTATFKGFDDAKNDAMDALDALIQKMDLADEEKSKLAANASLQLTAKRDKQEIDYLTKGLEDSIHGLQGLREANSTGLESTSEAYQRLILAQKELHKSYSELDPVEKARIDTLAHSKAVIEENTIAEQNFRIALDATKVGYGNLVTEAVADEARLAKLEESRLQGTLDTLNTINEHEQKSAQLRAQIQMAAAQKEKDILNFSIGSVRNWVAQQDNLWDGWNKMIGQTLDAVRSSLSDVLFNFFQTGTLKMKDAWHSLLGSMERALADFLAGQAVKMFLGLLFGESAAPATGSGGTSAAASAGGALGAAIIGGTGNSGLLGGAFSALGKALGIGGSNTLNGITGPINPNDVGGEVVLSGFPTDTTTDFSSFDSSLDAFASGGVVPGRGRGDIIPAMLEPGEFVVRRDVAQANLSSLSALNRGGVASVQSGVAYMADGGVVPSLTGNQAVINILYAIYQQQLKTVAATQATAQNTQTTAQAVDKSTSSSIVSPAATMSTSSSDSTASNSALNGILGLTRQGLSAGNAITKLTATGSTAANINSVLGLVSGGLGLYQGISNQNTLQAIGGGLQVGSGLTGLATTSGVLSQTAGAILSGGLGAAGGALGLYSSIDQMLKNGATVGGVANAVLSAYATYAGVATLSNAAFGTALPTIGSALSGITVGTAAPGITAATTAGVTGGELALGGAAETGAVAASGAAASIAAVAAPIVLAALFYMQNKELMDARSSGWWNNPIIGQLYGAAVQSINRSDQLAASVQNAGGVTALSNDDLRQLIGAYSNNLLPFYYTLQGGRGAVRAIDATGTSETLSTEAFTAKQNEILTNYSLAVAEMYRRTGSLSTLSGLDTAPQFSETGLAGSNASFGGGALQSAMVGASSSFSNYLPFIYAFQSQTFGTTDAMQLGSLSGGLRGLAYSPTFSPAATNEIFGGPAQATLAYLNPALFTQLGGMANFSGPLAQADIAGQMQAAAMADAVAQQAFTSGGGGMAEGGFVTGGIPGKDSVPTLLMPGEFVIPQPIASKMSGRLRALGSSQAVTDASVQHTHYNVAITVNGNVDDPEELVRVLAPRIRDELKRIDVRYSRAGNKLQV